jgi:ABC-2 type transport system permease protein
MRQVPSIRGWTFDQVVLIYGLTLLARSLSSLTTSNLWTLGHVYIQPGDFDRFLLRPIDPLCAVLVQGGGYAGLGDLLVGLVLVWHATLALHLSLTPLLVGYLLLAVVSGGAIFAGLVLIAAVPVFWLTDAAPLIGAVTELHQFARYPLSIYNRGVQGLLTWLVPYGFASFYPASYLLHRGAGPLAWLAPVVAAASLLVGYRFWNIGLRHYSSTGS